MKRRLSLLIALVMLVAFVLPTIAACGSDKSVEKLEVVDPKTEFVLGVDQTIDYDNLKLKVTYSDGSSETKTVKEWGATYTPADLSKEGTTSYIISYEGKSCPVSVTVKVQGGGTVDQPTQVTVTYKYNDGSTEDLTVSFNEGDKIKTLPTPNYDGHTFVGWYTVNGGDSDSDSAWGTKWTSDMPINSNITLYARWSKNRNTYVVTFDTGDAATTTTKTVTEGETVSFPDEPEKAENNFGGWWTKTADDQWGEEWKENTPVTDNLHLYAKWTPIDYTDFVFNYLDGQTHQGNSVRIVKGETLGEQLPTPEDRAGYRFDGWWTEDGSTSGNWGTQWQKDTAAVNDHYELFARWTATEANVRLEWNYPADLAESQPAAVEFKVNIGESIPAEKLSAEGNVPEGYTFDGWYTTRTDTAGSTGKKWQDADKVQAAVTLYARWIRITHTVTFVLGNGQANVTAENVPHGEGVGSAKWPQNPTWTDHAFLNWEDSAHKQVDSNTPITDDVTFTAVWKETATVTFDINGGTGNTPNAVTVDKNANLVNKLPDGEGFSRDGYRFDGWYTHDGKEDWGDKWLDTNAVSQNTTLYAKWVKLVTVTFDANGGNADSVPSPVTVDENTSLGDQFPNTTPTRNDEGNTKYVFDGWYADNKASGDAWNKDTKVQSSDVTLFAKWTETEITITYTLQYNDGTTPNGSATAANGQKVTQWPSPTRRGFDFGGWFDQENEGGTRYDSDSQPAATESKTLYARWTAKTKYTITLHLYTDSDAEKTIVISNLSADQLGLFEGEVVTLPTIQTEPQLTQREHYRFDGWYQDASCQTAQSATVTIGKANVDIYAKWVGQVTVHFVTGIPQEDDLETGKVVDITVDVNQTISSDQDSLKDLAWVGHTFVGWFYANTGDDALTLPYNVGNEAGEIWFYGRWRANRIAVTFDHNRNAGEGVETDVEYVDYGTDFDISSHVLTWENHTFVGWATDKDGTEVEWTENKQILKNVTAPQTLYAKWSKEITIGLVYGNGSQSVSFTIPSNSSLMTQFFLVQLNKVLQGQKDVLLTGIRSSGTMGSLMADSIEKSLAQINEMANTWQPYDMGIYTKVMQYSGDVVVDLMTALAQLQNEDKAVQANGVSGLTTALSILAGMKSVYDTVENGGKGLTAPTAPGQQFVNWNHSISGVMAPWPVAGTANTEKDPIHALGGYDMQPVPTNTLWLYGQWEEVEGAQKHAFTLDYNYQVNGANVTYTDSFYEGTEIKLPELTRNGYVFDGWYKDKDTWAQRVENSVTIGQEDVTLYAKWSEGAKTTVVVTLNNGSETRNFTVELNKSLNDAANADAELKAFLAAKTWLNGSTPYDLSTLVTTNLYLVAQAEGTKGGVVMSFSAPDFYLNYTQRSTTAGDDSLGYFKRVGDDAQPYEVGTVNKFIFRPVVRLRTSEGTVTDYNPTTSAKVFYKTSKDGSYTELTDATQPKLSEVVTVDNNTYKFADSTEDWTVDDKNEKFIKLEISLGEGYKLPSSVENKVTVEFKLVKGGYNVYDQRGLSVMNDNQQKVWAPLWGVEANIVADPTNSDEARYQYKVEFTDNGNAVKLAADDQPLYKYVGNVDWVILHNDLDLDPTQMPQDFFWQSGDPLYYSAYQSLAGWSNQQNLLVGSLKDGDNSGREDTQNYMPMYDIYPDYMGSRSAFQVGFDSNMQKGFYSTHKVSVSGNYFSLTHILERGGRRLQNYVDWDNDTRVNDPVPHWSVFQLMTNKNHNGIAADSGNRGTKDNPFTVKNIAMKGSTPQKDYYDKGKTVYFAPAGIMLANTYSSINFDNINANNFFTVIVGDNYGESQEADFITKFDVHNSKLYDVYSNMIYTWRGNIVVSDSDFVGSGGPLFIMCDGLNTDNGVTGEAILAGTDEGGPSLTVTGNCRLEAYATGAESWYDANNATALVTMMRGQVEDLFNEQLHKTLRWVKSGDRMVPYTDSDRDKNQYINVIGVMICSPGNLINGLKEETLDVRGTSSFWGTTSYAMHNLLIKNIRKLQEKNGTKFPLVAEMCSSAQSASMNDLFMMTDLKDMLDIPGTADVATYTAAWQAAKAADYNNKVCVYMSAGSISGSQYAPYFGVIMDIGDYTKA